MRQVLIMLLDDSNDRESFVGFICLVGKDPDIERGLLVGTGASVNLLGSKGLQRF